MKPGDTEELSKGKAPDGENVGPNASLTTERRVLTIFWVLNFLSSDRKLGKSCTSAGMP